MERNQPGPVISIQSALDDRKESFHLFVRAEDKMCDEGRVVRTVVQIRRMMERSGDNSDGVEKMRAAAEENVAIDEKMRTAMGMRR